MRVLDIEGRKMKPTKRHRPAIWECILGAVFAMNENREVKYFDYDHEGAKEFGGINNSNDVRFYKYNKETGSLIKDKTPDSDNPLDKPRWNKLVIWVEEHD